MENKIVRNLNTEGENMEVVRKILGKDKEVHDLSILIRHSVSNTKSKVSVKAVLYSESKLNFTGKIIIDKDCGGCDAFLELKVLLIGDKVRVLANPQLEILNNNVKCGHSVAISRPDEKELSYLMSRGISWDKAVQLIAEGFMTEQ